MAGIRSGWLHTPSPTSLLSDVRVLDLTRVWAGPLATRILGDFGADVIRISDPRVPLDRLSGTNNKLNRNKVNLALRLDHEEGRELFLELVATSDVVVENFRPRVMLNFDLTYERLQEARPDIVMCSMPGFGTTGEYADYPAFGPSVEAMTGLPSMMGYEGGEPRTSALAFPDPVAALNSVAAINDCTASSETDRRGAVHRLGAHRGADLPDRRACRGLLAHGTSAFSGRQLASGTCSVWRVSRNGRRQLGGDLCPVRRGVAVVGAAGGTLGARS